LATRWSRANGFAHGAGVAPVCEFAAGWPVADFIVHDNICAVAQRAAGSSGINTPPVDMTVYFADPAQGLDGTRRLSEKGKNNAQKRDRRSKSALVLGTKYLRNPATAMLGPL